MKKDELKELDINSLENVTGGSVRDLRVKKINNEEIVNLQVVKSEDK